MIRRPPRSTRTDTLFPYTPLFRSRACSRSLFAVGRAPRSQIFPILVIGPVEVYDRRFQPGKRLTGMGLEIGRRNRAQPNHLGAGGPAESGWGGRLREVIVKKGHVTVQRRPRSEERRVGKGGVSTGKKRWATYQ